MRAFPQSVRVTIECQSCEGMNELIIDNVEGSQVVTCSHCARPLGSVFDLARLAQSEEGSSPDDAAEGSDRT